HLLGVVDLRVHLVRLKAVLLGHLHDLPGRRERREAGGRRSGEVLRGVRDRRDERRGGGGPEEDAPADASFRRELPLDACNLHLVVALGHENLYSFRTLYYYRLARGRSNLAPCHPHKAASAWNSTGR